MWADDVEEKRFETAAVDSESLFWERVTGVLPVADHRRTDTSIRGRDTRYTIHQRCLINLLYGSLLFFASLSKGVPRRLTS